MSAAPKTSKRVRVVIMTPLEYMDKQLSMCKRRLEAAKKRPGVTRREIDDLITKAGYYEAAVIALTRKR